MPQAGHPQSQSLWNRKPARMPPTSTIGAPYPGVARRTVLYAIFLAVTSIDFLTLYPPQSFVSCVNAFHSFSSPLLNFDLSMSQLHQGEEREGEGGGEGGSNTSWRRTKTLSTAALPTFFMVRAASRSTSKSVGAKFQMTCSSMIVKSEIF